MAENLIKSGCNSVTLLFLLFELVDALHPNQQLFNYVRIYH